VSSLPTVALRGLNGCALRLDDLHLGRLSTFRAGRATGPVTRATVTGLSGDNLDLAITVESERTVTVSLGGFKILARDTGGKW